MGTKFFYIPVPKPSELFTFLLLVQREWYSRGFIDCQMNLIDDYDYLARV